MRKYLLIFLVLTSWLRSDWDQIFSNDEDPSLFHHVNVITGHLNLCFQDCIAEGAKSLPLLRTYSSAGALEKVPGNPDLKLKEIRGDWLIQGGWNILPHANLLLESGREWEDVKVYLAESGGNIMTYRFAKKRHKIVTLQPEWKGGQISGVISAKNNPQNNRLELRLGEGKAVLFLPNGGTRTYFRNGDTEINNRVFFLIEEEFLPSGHYIKYDYDKQSRLIHIAFMNPAKNKTLSSIHFDLTKTKSPYQFQVRTSCGKNLDYQAMEHKQREYLCNVGSNARFQEHLEYQEGRKGIGARLINISFDGRLQLGVEYFLPKDKGEAKKWLKHPQKKPFEADKIRILKAPIGPQGQFVEMARFSYHPNYTDVRDVHNILTRFHHDSKCLTCIEYFNEKDELYSVVKFFWHEQRVRCKALLNPQGQVLFAKTFEYDSVGNVVNETFWGNLTGTVQDPLNIDDNGKVSGGENSQKKYAYLPQFNLPILEEEENGPTYRYHYKTGTDLITAKFTCDKDKIVIRNFYFYNEDHLLVSEITDDGSGSESDDLTNVNFRQIKRFELDSSTGLVKTAIESYLDLESQTEQILKKVENAYSPQNRLIAEAFYDAEGNYRYTVETDYNAQGRVIRKTNPLGQANHYVYDIQGRLLKSQEVGAPQKTYTYDEAGRPLTCLEVDFTGKSKISSA